MMSVIYQDLTVDFDAASSTARLYTVVSQMATLLDFEHWRFERASYSNYARPETVVIGTLPPAWGHQEQLQDPTRLSLEAGKQHLQLGAVPTPKIWGVNLDTATTCGLISEGELTTAAHIKLSHCEGFLNPKQQITGWSQAIRGSDGASVGMLSLLRENKPLTLNEIAQKQSHVHWLAHSLHSKLAALQTTRIKISGLEREIMRWTADGKSTAEIASILQMKERSVTFRVSSVVARMGVQNKTAAAVRLAVGGLLF